MSNLAKVTQYQAISFDGDMTLWDFEKVMRHSLSKVLVHLKQELPTAEISVEDMIRIRNGVAESLRGQVTNLEQIRLQAFIQTLKYLDVDDPKLAAHLNALYLKHRFEDIELYDDVKPTLNHLNNLLFCGLISNGNSYPERCGLEDIFSFVIFSQEVGIEKPDPAIFEVAFREVGCEAEALIHVGDSLESDVAGANAVGAVSVWLNRDNRENTSSIVPDFEINTLRELFEIIPASV